MYNKFEFNAVPIDEITTGKIIPNPTITPNNMPLNNSVITEFYIPEIIIPKPSDSIPPESKKLSVIENKKSDTKLLTDNDSSINDTSKSSNDSTSVNPKLDPEFDFFRWISNLFSLFLNLFSD